MTSMVRYLAIGSAGLALLCVIAWLVTGAVIPPTEGPLADYSGTNKSHAPYAFEAEASASDTPGVLEQLKTAGYPAEDMTGGYEDWSYHHILIKGDFYQETRTVGVRTAEARTVRKAIVLVPTPTTLQHLSGIHFLYPEPVYWSKMIYYTRPGRDGIPRSLIFDITQYGSWAAYAALFVLASSVTAAALLGLLMLLKGTRSASVRDLGVGLCLWSLSIAYLWLFSVVSTFDALRPTSLSLGLCADTLAFLLLLAANHEFRRFWDGFPRDVTSEELDSFLAALAREQYKLMGPVRKAVLSLSRGHAHPDAAPDTLAAPPTGAGLLSKMALIPMPIKTGVLILAVLGLSYVWRQSVMHHGTSDIFTIVGPIPIVALAIFTAMVYWPGIRCLRLFKFHSIAGDEEDRRKIEWIRAALWMGFIVSIVPTLGLAILSVVSRFSPDLDVDLLWGPVYLMLGLMSGPLLVILALALSILYRGNVDPRLALKGVTVTTLLGVILTLLFVIVERTIAIRAVAWFSLPPQTGFIAAGAVVTATFQPIRKRSEKYVNRFVERVLPATMLASGTRRTAAVAIVDISSYTALSAKDEQAALLASALVQKEGRRLSDKHGGRVVKSTGDGVIMCFSGADRCLDAISELHAAVTNGAAALSLPDLKLHSGLNWGEVVEMHDGDIYGQTVNITARIADWAKAGEIGMSQAFSDALSAPGAGFISAGPQSFKNVPEPVSCLKTSMA